MDGLSLARNGIDLINIIAAFSEWFPSVKKQLWIRERHGDQLL